jgi:hypothetical protein
MKYPGEFELPTLLGMVQLGEGVCGTSVRDVETRPEPGVR